ncbi:MAG: Sugar transferase [Nitrospira sp.]|nr:MAG: Sugar transferase [Nitrospira sp.]
MNLAPIALFAYRRPTHLQRTVEALRRNPQVSSSQLFVFSDGPKQPSDETAVRQVREYLRTLSGFGSVEIVERNRNWGLANSIIDGVSQICQKYGRVIVLEDDLSVSPHFLEYMNTALDLYEHDNRVMQISGYMFPLAAELEEDAIFLPFITSWGWATWVRAWRHFDSHCAAWPDIKNESEALKAFDLGGAYPYSSMVEAQFRGEIDSWAIRWYVSVFAHKGLVLFPRQTLVNNSGLEGSGTHGKGPSIWRLNHPSDDFAVRVFPKNVFPSQAVKLITAAIGQGRASYFNRACGWIHGILARIQSRD